MTQLKKIISVLMLILVPSFCYAQKEHVEEVVDIIKHRLQKIPPKLMIWLWL